MYNIVKQSMLRLYLNVGGKFMSDNSEVVSKFQELKEMFEVLELDAVKSNNGNAAAGLRLRKGLRQLKTKAGELVKLTLESDKKKKDNK